MKVYYHLNIFIFQCTLKICLQILSPSFALKKLCYSKNSFLNLHNYILTLEVLLKVGIKKKSSIWRVVSGQQKDVLKPSKMRCKIKASKF